jgi:hypothetical protein
MTNNPAPASSPTSSWGGLLVLAFDNDGMMDDEWMMMDDRGG